MTVQELATKAQNGDAASQFHLAVCFYNGTAVAKDNEKAVYWWTKAAADVRRKQQEDAEFARMLERLRKTEHKVFEDLRKRRRELERRNRAIEAYNDCVNSYNQAISIVNDSADRMNAYRSREKDYWHGW